MNNTHDEQRPGAAERVRVLVLLGSLVVMAGACRTDYYEPPFTDVRVPAFPVPDYRGVRTFSFEGSALPDIESTAPGSARFDKKHFHDGNQALRWTWKAPDSRLVFRVPIPYKKPVRDYSKAGRDVSVFSSWIYRETRLPGASLRITFTRNGEDACYFDYGLDFTGWRLICVKFDDMTGTPQADMDAIVLRSPPGVTSGELWLDVLQPLVAQDGRWQWPDYQMPFIPSRLSNALYLDSPEAQRRQALPLPPKTGKHIAAIKAKVISRYGGRTFSEEACARLRAYYASLHISKTAERIQGKTVSEQEVRTYLDYLLKAATLYHAAPRNRRAELRRMYLLMCEHLLDQGWAEGSALNAQHHFGYKSRSWAPAVLLMEDVLARRNLFEPMVRSMIWFGRDFLDYTQPYETCGEATRRALSGRLADYLNTFANTHLICLLLLPDTAFKEEALINYRGLLSDMITCGNGALKPDGSFFHHGMHYAGYAVPAMYAVADIVHTLDGSPFEITPEAYRRLKTVFTMAEKWGYPNWAFNACGRHPITGSIARMKGPFEKLAVSVPGTDGVDADLANLCRTVFGEPSQPQLQALSAVPHPSRGFWSMNYAATGVYKWGDWTAILKGYGRGVRSHETYGRDNRFGRYGSHGTMLLFGKGAPDASGIVYKGWDWTQPPGATTLQLPLDLLEGSATNFYGWNPPQKAPFSGSGHLDNRRGAFAFALDGQQHEQSLQVRKSVFAVAGMLVCLGSDIANTSDRFRTVTTLFQCGGEKRTALFSATHEETSRDEYRLRQVLKDRTDWLIDPQGNGFLLPPGNDDLVVQRGPQSSLHDKTKKPTQGRFVKAWLDHGTHPEGASYEYLVKLAATPGLMERLASLMEGPEKLYEVLSRNRSRHAIRVPGEALSLYVFFEPVAPGKEKGKRDGDILAVDLPLILVSRQDANGGLTLSVTDTNPSLRRAFDAPEPVREATVHLRGVFHASPSAVVRGQTARAGTTILRLALKGPHSRTVHLEPGQD